MAPSGLGSSLLALALTVPSFFGAGSGCFCTISGGEGFGSEARTGGASLGSSIYVLGLDSVGNPSGRRAEKLSARGGWWKWGAPPARLNLNEQAASARLTPSHQNNRNNSPALGDSPAPTISAMAAAEKTLDYLG
jgi:hypothetical protein